MAITSFERYPLTFGPSPIHPLPRLGAHLGGAQIWAKREDVNSGLAFGGNKTRKLEYFVPEALAQGADTLVSIGGLPVQSHPPGCRRGRQTRPEGTAGPENWVDWPDPLSDRVGNIQLSRMMGADVRLDRAGFDIGIRSSWQRVIDEVEASGGKPYAIPAGGSDHRLGGPGFANWAYEVEQQERDPVLAKAAESHGVHKFGQDLEPGVRNQRLASESSRNGWENRGRLGIEKVLLHDTEITA